MLVRIIQYFRLIKLRRERRKLQLLRIVVAELDLALRAEKMQEWKRAPPLPSEETVPHWARPFQQL